MINIFSMVRYDFKSIDGGTHLPKAHYGRWGFGGSPECIRRRAGYAEVVGAGDGHVREPSQHHLNEDVGSFHLEKGSSMV